MVPSVNGDLNIVTYTQPSKTYKLDKDLVVTEIDGLEALIQTIDCIPSTERESQLIYNTNYGSELERYIGLPLYFIEADIENTLKEALLRDNRITDVVVNSVKEVAIDGIEIDFTVYTVFGNVNKSINISD